MRYLEKIFEFSCPYWEDLPNEGIMSRELVEYINKTLGPIFLDKVVITPTMVQNYSKWNLLPEINGRKYYRSHIAILIVISIYKNVLDINEVRAGIDLELKLMSLNDSYDVFADALNKALKSTFSATRKKKFTIKKITMENNEAGVDLVAHAFAFKLLTKLIIKYNGYENLKENEENE